MSGGERTPGKDRREKGEGGVGATGKRGSIVPPNGRARGSGGSAWHRRGYGREADHRSYARGGGGGGVKEAGRGGGGTG